MKIYKMKKLRSYISYLLWLTTTLPFLLHCLSLHTTVKTFLVTTKLTAIPLLLINYTISILSTSIREIFSYCSLEKSLTSFTAEKGEENNFNREKWNSKCNFRALIKSNENKITQHCFFSSRRQCDDEFEAYTSE